MLKQLWSSYAARRIQRHSNLRAYRTLQRFMGIPVMTNQTTQQRFTALQNMKPIEVKDLSYDLLSASGQSMYTACAVNGLGYALPLPYCAVTVALAVYKGWQSIHLNRLSTYVTAMSISKDVHEAKKVEDSLTAATLAQQDLMAGTLMAISGYLVKADLIAIATPDQYWFYVAAALLFARAMAFYQKAVQMVILAK